LEQFPEADLISEEARALRSVVLKRRTNTIPHWEPLWSGEYILDRIAEMHRRGLPLNSGWVQEKEKHLHLQSLKIFGSWDEALRRAGLNPQEIRLSDPALHLTRDQIVRRLLNRKKRGLSLNHSAVHADDLRLYGAIKRTYGAYDSGLRAAGLNPTRVRVLPAKINEKAAQQFLKKVRAAAVLPKSKRARIWKSFQKRYFRLARNRRFGSWVKVFQEAGVNRSLFPIAAYDPQNRVLVRFPSRQSVLDEFHRRLQAGLPIHSKAVLAVDPVFYKGAIKYFGRYSKLCLRLGQPTRMPQRTRFPDRQSVIDAFLGRIERGELVSSGTIYKCEGTLAKAIKEHFGGYKNLAAFIGLPPRKLRKSRYPDSASVVHELENRLARKLPITSTALYKSNPALNAAVRKFFGSFGAMYTFLGQAKPRMARYPDPDAALAALRQREKDGLSMGSYRISREDGALYSAILKFFGGINEACRLF
jgi:hypothetical protein